MGTKIIELPVTNAVLGDGYIPISQDPTGNNRVTYKVTAQQIANYIGQTTSSGTVNNVDIQSSDASIFVTGSPITTRGTINVSINTVNLNKLQSGGATNGQVLTYDSIINQWKPVDSSNTGVTADSVQIGTVLWFAASSAPIGYLECNGSSKKISDYPELAVVLGTTYGNLINGGTEFILPDLRGEFVRGWDHGRGVDTGRIFGSWQKGSLHVVGSGPTPDSISDYNTNPGNIGRDDSGYDAVSDLSKFPNFSYTNNGPPSQAGDLNMVDMTYGTTRPRNVALLPCIKALKTVQTTTSLLNFIEKPTNPSEGQILTYNNYQWIASNANKSSQFKTVVKLTTVGNGFWTVPAGVTKIDVHIVGGGGGGFQGTGNNADQFGTGGSGAGYAILLDMDVTPGQAIPYTIGAGGTVNRAVNEGRGGTSSFGSTLSATGGYGGFRGASNIQTNVGIGINGTYNFSGGIGGSTYASDATAGNFKYDIYLPNPYILIYGIPGYGVGAFGRSLPAGYGAGGGGADHTSGSDGTQGAIVILY